jgi:hypothetical protein|eukprot:SAG25_NODE_1701_length_2519_cov_4.563636_2_plen_73_part_00
MAAARARAGQPIGHSAPAAKSARARAPAAGSISADAAFQIKLCGPRGAVHRRRRRRAAAAAVAALVTSSPNG